MMDGQAPDRRIAVAIFLSIAVVLIYTELFVKPKLAPINQTSSLENSASQTNAEAKTAPAFKESQKNNKAQTFAAVPETKNLTNSDYLNAPSVQVNTNKYHTKISLLGGRLISFTLNDYKKEVNSDEPLNLINSNLNDFPLGVSVTGFNDSAVEYKLLGLVSNNNFDKNITVSDKPLKLELEGSLTEDVSLKKILTFSNNSYLFDVDLVLSKVSADGSPLKLEWSDYFDPKEKASRYNPKLLTNLDMDSSLDRLPTTKFEDKKLKLNSKWLAFGDNYFTSILINKNNSSPSNVISKDMHVSYKLEGKQDVANFSVYLGPKNNADLEATGYSILKTIDLGWFSFIGQPILSCLKVLNNFLGNYGLAIILFTILLRLALLPLTKITLNSMKNMQKIQPEMAALKERIEDPKQLQQEMFGLYKKHGVNPLGGCLPMLIQIPVLFGVFTALRSSIDLRHTPFALWIQDMSAPEALDIFGYGFPLMALLMGMSMIAQQLLTPTAVSDPAQKKMMYIMPFAFTAMFLIFPFPAGLTLYWLVSNLLSIIQNITIKSEKDVSPLLATIVAGVVVYGFGWGITLI